VDPVEAAQIVWLDAFTANVDRSWRNPNLLVWHRQLWCIDHGAALRFHHDWSRRQRFATATYDYGDHVLGERAAPLQSAAEQAAATVSADLLHEVLDMVPDTWLEPDELRPDAGAPADADEARRAYCETLLARLDASEHWLSAVAPR
jgi:hypothetical protein